MKIQLLNAELLLLKRTQTVNKHKRKTKRAINKKTTGKIELSVSRRRTKTNNN